MTDFAVQAAIVAAVLNLSLAGIALVRGPRRRLNRSFAFLSLVVFLWILGRLTGLVSVGLVALILLPLAALVFCQVLLHDRNRRSRILLLLTAGISLSLVTLALMGHLTEPLHRWVLPIYLILVVGHALLRLNRRRRVTRSRLERQQLMVILVGVLAAMTAGGVDLLRQFGVELPAIGSLGVLIYVIAISVAIARFGLMDLSVLIGRSAVLFVMTFMLFSLWGLLGGFWTDQRIASFFSIVVATVVILIVYEPLRGLIERRADRVIQREGFELRNLLSGLSREISREIDRQEILVRVGRGLAQAGKLSGYSIYLDDDQGVLTPVLSHPKREAAPNLGISSPLPELTRQRKGPVIQDEVDRELQLYLSMPRRQLLKAVSRAMHRVRASMTVPLLSQDRVIGLINVATRDSDATFNLAERDLFMAVASQVALAVEKARMYERVREQDRLALLGEMASGLAHEVRNPLAVIKATAQYLGPGLPPEENTEFLRIIVQEVDRLNRVVSSFLDYARPPGSNREPGDLGPLLTDVVDRIGQRAGPSIQISLETEDLPPDLPMDQTGMERVLENLLQNAVEALPEGGQIAVRARLSRPRIGEEMVILTISDNGPGIPADARERLFDPFFTTREEGTGLGLAIVQKIVQAHGGSIHLRSRSGRGTTFQIDLPR